MVEEKKGYEETLHKVQEKIIELAERVKEEVIELSKIGKSKLDILSLKKQREDIFKDLGKNIYELLKKKDIELPLLKPLSDKIENIEAKISKLEAEVEELTKQEKKRWSKKNESTEDKNKTSE